MRQEFLDSVNRVIVDFAEHILEPDGGVQVSMFAGVDEGIDDGNTLSGFVVSGEQIVFPSDSDRADSIFHQVIVDFQAAVQEEVFQVFLSFEGIGDGCPDRTFRQGFFQFSRKPPTNHILPASPSALRFARTKIAHNETTEESQGYPPDDVGDVWAHIVVGIKR